MSDPADLVAPAVLLTLGALALLSLAPKLYRRCGVARRGECDREASPSREQRLGTPRLPRPR